MIKVKTVLVLGAGSSQEVGLPVGSELAARMAPNLDIRFDGEKQISGLASLAAIIIQAAKSAGISPNDYRAAACRISAGLGFASSIDSFIDMHREDPHVAAVGKLAIVGAILEAEHGSTLYLGDHPESAFTAHPFPNAKGTWFRLAEMLFEGVTKSQIDKVFKNLSVINFNYDRCLEHFLTHALRAAYSIGLSEAEALVAKLQVWHPYGVVGGLPNVHPNEQQCPFGVDAAPNFVASLAKGIRTFAERLEDPEALNAPRQWLTEASTVLFLGFSFNEQNMKLIKAPKSQGGQSVFGTAYRMSDANVAVARTRIIEALNLDPAVKGTSFPIRNDLSCLGLIDEYRQLIQSGIGWAQNR